MKTKTIYYRKGIYLQGKLYQVKLYQGNYTKGNYTKFYSPKQVLSLAVHVRIGHYVQIKRD